MYYLKSCVRCSGDLHLERDSYGSYLKCLQCGRTIELQTRAPGLTEATGGGLKKQAA